MQKIIAAKAKPDYHVFALYDDGASYLLDLSGLIVQGTVFAVLENPEVFAQVYIGNRGRSLAWSDMLELDALALRLEATPENGLKHKIISFTAATAQTPDPVSLQVQQALSLAKVTQSEAAKRTGLTQPTIARLANPNYHGHSIDSLRRLSQGLGLDLEVRIGKPKV